MKSWTLCVFLGVYLCASFVLFRLGLVYLKRLPVVGDVLVERVIYVMFLTFLIMLVFSNAVINFMGLYRNRETQWILSLPIPVHAILLWKMIETLVLSSWSLLLLSAPIFLAFGMSVGADVAFYGKTVALLLPFLLIPACLGTLALLLVMRFYQKWWNWVVSAIFSCLVLWLVKSLMFRAKLENVDPQAEVALAPESISGLGGALAYTEGTMHPLLPSSWLAESVMAWSHGYAGAGWFYSLVMVSYALMSLLVTYGMSAWLFFPSWNASVFRGGGEVVKHAAGTRLLRERGWVPRWLGWVHFLPQQFRGLLVKDLLTMWRDGSQRVQFLVVFGLLFFYSLNIQNLGHDFQNPARLTAVSYLNLVICTLALSMLTTRFVFPQFSMEGQRIWILGLSPLPLTHVLWQKLATSVVLTGVCTLPLLLISGMVMRLPAHLITYYMGALAIMNGGLNVIAICFGALFPNMRDNNPARIVSGFGGTLCLLASFVYIVFHIAVLVLPALSHLSVKWRFASESTLMTVSIVFLVIFNILLLCVLTFFAKKQIKNWNF